ncbi:hypothetical protein [Thalassobacillus pellis]|uniref:hypothetical protein n=1 Tax=Thalassobacillus pellis TaxID=748008 RepID=UPI0019608E20|nr:hypothetical protein [Thalassobacillus pellis]MBM7551855.1 hypothetical protein [Thalassobacillus pellis]
MKEFLSMLSFILLVIALVGCNNGYEIKGITEIEVYHYKSNEKVSSITDKRYIRKLLTELNTAETISTETADINSPEYILHFKNKEKVQFKLNYYQDPFVADLDEERRVGRYHSSEKEVVYDVALELPVK